MEGFLKQNTAVNVTVLLVSSSDHITGATSKTLTIYATKAAGTPVLITPTVTELDSTNVPGIYKVALTSSHTDTVGELQLHITASGADPTDVKWQVAAYILGDTLPANTTQLAGQTVTAAAGVTFPSSVSNYAGGAVASVTAAVTVGTNNDKTGYGLSAAGIQAIWDALTSALTTVGSIGKLLVSNIDAAISSRLASAGYTAPDNTTIAAIKGVLPSSLTAGGNMKADAVAVNGSANAAQNLAGGLNTVASGTVGSSATTTSIPTAAFSPAGTVSGQFIGRTIVFADNTTTAALQGQAATISGSTNAANPTLTVSALTTAPVSGDTFWIF